jgi:nitrogen regulatory protein PII
MKRIDLFISEREVTKVCKALRTVGVPGYSVMRHVTGMGLAGEISEAMDFSGLGANAHLIVFCPPEQVDEARSALRPLFEVFGGVGFVSDAEPF